MTSTDSNIAKEVSKHLEFLGFTVKDVGEEKGRALSAVRDAGSNFWINITGSMLWISASWSGFDAKALKSKDFFKTLNDVNKAVYSKWYFEGEEGDETLVLKIEMVYYGYEKTTFGSLIETLDREINGNLNSFQAFMK